MNILFSNDWHKTYENIPVPHGLYARFEKEIHPFIRTSLIYYLQWLRKEYHFPVRINVYCKSGDKVRCRDKDLAYGVIYLPFDRSKLPSIRLACGNFQHDAPVTKDLMDTTDLILFSLTHEIVHYFQYINNIQLTPRGMERQATIYSRSIIEYYLSLCDD